MHTCAAGAPLALLRGAGAQGLSVDFALLSAADHDALAEALEAGATVALGVLPGTDPATEPTDTQLTESVLRWLDMLGTGPGRGGGPAGGDAVLRPRRCLAGLGPHRPRVADPDRHQPRLTTCIVSGCCCLPSRC